jgi:hypothetical protein
MKTTRQSAFETNSSSTHSITINQETALFDSISPDYDGVIRLTGGEFGWEWKKYDDAITKANYCAVAAMGDEFKTELLVNVIKTHTGAKDVEILCQSDYESNNRSYIDHQSAGKVEPAFADENSLKRFIFDRKSILFTGNDNGGEPPNFYDMDVDKMSHVVEVEGSSTKYYMHPENISDRLKVWDAVMSVYENGNIYSERPYDTDNICWEVDWQRGIDMDSRTLKLHKTKPVYSDAGERRWLRNDIIDEMYLKFTISNRFSK